MDILIVPSVTDFGHRCGLRTQLAFHTANRDGKELARVASVRFFWLVTKGGGTASALPPLTRVERSAPQR